MRAQTIMACSLLFAGVAQAQPAPVVEKKPATEGARSTQTCYLAFQIFTYGPDPRIPSMGEGRNPIARFPDKATLRDYIEDIKAADRYGGQTAHAAGRHPGAFQL